MMPRSRRNNADIDRVVTRVLDELGPEHVIREFSPYGYDERQFCSPGFNLPVGRFSRSEYGTYPQYHTSADDLQFVSPDSLSQSLAILIRVVQVLERNRSYRNLQPWCEPQLGRRGLYDDLEQLGDTEQIKMALLWALNLSDGSHDLLDIATRAGLPFTTIAAAADLLEEAELLERVGC